MKTVLWGFILVFILGCTDPAPKDNATLNHTKIAELENQYKALEQKAQTASKQDKVQIEHDMELLKSRIKRLSYTPTKEGEKPAPASH